ncbi:hypothetical protein VNO80_08162 [Phaseolus coccineus]|uniref:Uncharacterized protein n=1 Tax=Phaseolus coccineus TaxID=3886 RepID=A0AAN9NLK4_PHACN
MQFASTLFSDIAEGCIFSSLLSWVCCILASLQWVRPVTNLGHNAGRCSLICKKVLFHALDFFFPTVNLLFVSCCTSLKCSFLESCLRVLTFCSLPKLSVFFKGLGLGGCFFFFSLKKFEHCL